MSRARQILPPAILTITLLTIYWTTMAPGLTWANSGADGGDLIAAAATGGVAHPSGYPLYVILAEGFQSLPLGSLAHRTNLMSAFFMASAAVLVCLLACREVGKQTQNGAWLAGLVSGLAFGLAPLVWSQAVITEVYALHAFLVALLLYLAMGSETAVHPKWLDLASGLIFGLAMGNHVTMVLLIPVVLLPSVSRGLGAENSQAGKRSLRGWQVNGPVLMRRILGMGAGLLVYLILPMRALSRPPVNWGNPVTPENFWWLVSGKLYQDDFILALPQVVERIRFWAALSLEQFGLPGLILGLAGLVFPFNSSSLHRNTQWIALLFTLFAIVYGTVDSYVYLIPVYLCFAIWIGFGLARILNAAVRRWRIGGQVIGLLALAYFSALAVRTFSKVDASHDPRAEQFGEAVLVQAPENAIVFAKGDQAVFALWYFHFVLRERPDIAVVAPELIGFEWYLETLRATYPDLIVPGPIPSRESLVVANPTRPVCDVQYTQWMEIHCARPQEP